MTREFELCAETLQACAAASEGGADRIELCAALGEGGVTPSRGLLREALAAVRVPVHVLVRPRAGGFVYSAAEFRVMCQDVQDAVATGAAGVVVGVVTKDRTIHRDRMEELMQLATGRAVTFHRAFDQLHDLRSSLETLIDLGCARVLTSGGLPTVSEGFDSLTQLAQQAAGRIRVAAGGGVTLENAARLVAVPGLDLHASLRSKAAQSSVGDPLWQEHAREVSIDVIRGMRVSVHGAKG